MKKSIDEIEQMLESAKGVKNVVRYKNGDYQFERNINFTVRGTEYKIVWYKNLSTLYAGNVEINFTAVEFSGTWPNKFKDNLQFYYENEVIAIIGVNNYDTTNQ